MENPNRKAGWCHWETGCSPSFCQSKALTSFLLRNRGPGPFAEEVALCRAVPGDLVQLWDSKGPFHSLILVENQGEGPLVASHSFHTWRRHLEDFPIGVPRFFHILGCWK